MHGMGEMAPGSYPKEYLVQLVDNQTLLGRIVISKTSKKFMVELDLVLAEGQKIYKHIDLFFSCSDEEEVLSEAIFKLKTYFEKNQQSDK